MFNIQDLIDETKCYAEVRKLRWPHEYAVLNVGRTKSANVDFTITSHTGNGIAVRLAPSNLMI